MTFDPKQQQCLGRYLYGAGYYSRDDNTLGLVTGQKTPPHFCMTCPVRKVCEDKHDQRVREMMPAECENFDRVMAEGRRRDASPLLVKAYLGQQGRDPFMAVAMENFTQGHGDRGAVAGPLTQ